MNTPASPTIRASPPQGAQQLTVEHATEPDVFPDGSVSWGTVETDWKVVECFPHTEFVGKHVFNEIPGIAEALGDDFHYAMTTRESLYVRRYWNGSLHDVDITPHADGSLSVRATSLLTMTPADRMSLDRLAAYASRVSAALEAGAGSPLAPETFALLPSPSPGGALRLVPTRP